MCQLPIFLINLDRSPDRLAHMESQAARLGVQFKRVAGVDGLALPANMKAEFLRPDGTIRSGMLPGEVGCYASHLLVCERIIVEGLPYAVVLEDDPTLDQRLPEVATAAVATCPANWDIIHLWHASERQRFIKLVKVTDQHSLVRHRRRPINTAAYIISLAAATKLRAPSPRARPIDIEMRYINLLGLIRVYGITPPVIVPAGAGTASMIDPTRQRNDDGGRWRPRLTERLTSVFRRARSSVSVPYP